MKAYPIGCVILCYFCHSFGISAATSLSPINTEAAFDVSERFTVECVVYNLTKELDDIVWKHGDTILSSNETCTVDKGTYEVGSLSQRTALTVSGSDTGKHNMRFKCTVSASDPSTKLEELVELRFYTITPNDRRITTGVAQTISCDIDELDGAADVRWTDPEGAIIPKGVSTNYSVEDGKAGFKADTGSQTTKLTLKSSIVSTMKSTKTYKCSVTSGHFPSSPPFTRDVAVTPITITAGNREVVSGADAVEISCKVVGVTAQLQTVKWEAPDGTDVTNGVTWYTFKPGSFADGSQTTTLTVASAKNNADSTYKCLITPAAQDDATEFWTDVALKIYTVTATPMSTTIYVNQKLTCKIEGLDSSHPVTVAWKDPDNAAVSETDTDNYSLSQGTVDGNGNQEAVLTIKTAKLSNFDGQASFTYTCSVTSSQYPDSPASSEVDVVANVVTIGVQAVHKEQLKDTEATISCIVTGLTKALDSVKWTKSDDSTITSGTDGFTIDTGSYIGGTQTTILTVPTAETDQDKTYKCLITSNEHNETKHSTIVDLKVFAVDSTPESVTTDADQTLTCKIGGLDDSHPVTVSWKDPDNAAVSDTDTDNYSLSQGTVDGSGNQEPVLTIKTAKLSDFNDQTSFTYTCSVTSSQYPESPTSTDVDVIANIEKTLGVQAVHKEQLKDTEAMISCIVTGLTKALDNVNWTKSDDSTITSGTDGFTIDIGSYSGGTQTTILTVPTTETDQDKTYKCLITSNEHNETKHSTTVDLKVFAVDSTPESVTTDTDQTLTCKIGGLDVSHPVTVAWKDPDNAAVSETDTNNYVLSQGTVDGTGNQEAVLTIKTAKLSDFNDQTSFTYKCSVTSSQYPESPASTDVDVIANVKDGKDTSKKGMQVEAIVGGSVGGAMIVLGAAAFAFVLFKKTAARVAVTTIEVNTFERNTGATTHTNSADEENCNSNKIAIHINSD